VPAVVPPVTIPVPIAIGITVATASGLELQVPPATASLSVIVSPGHTAAAPVIGGGGVFTATVKLAEQPLPIVYNTVAVPPVVPTPLNTPVTIFIVATVVGVTVHAPPVNASVSGIVLPGTRQIDPSPLIGGGVGFTVTSAIAGQPVPATV
jgi:hypothetical protein